MTAPLKISAADFRAVLAGTKLLPARKHARAQAETPLVSSGAGKGGPRHTPGEMNKTERAYAAELEWRKQRGEVSDFWFERVKLKLAGKTYYTPDFLVRLADGSLEFHEVKGFWQDDARVKFKVAAEQVPWARFIAVRRASTKQGGGWQYESI